MGRAGGRAGGREVAGHHGWRKHGQIQAHYLPVRRCVALTTPYPPPHTHARACPFEQQHTPPGPTQAATLTASVVTCEWLRAAVMAQSSATPPPATAACSVPSDPLPRPPPPAPSTEAKDLASNFKQSMNWAAITCIVVTAPLIGKVAQVAADRLLGTVIGGFIGEGGREGGRGVEGAVRPGPTRAEDSAAARRMAHTADADGGPAWHPPEQYAALGTAARHCTTCMATAGTLESGGLQMHTCTHGSHI